MSTENQLKIGWIEEQQLVERINSDRARLREIRQARVRLLNDLCTDRPLFAAIEQTPAPSSDLAGRSGQSAQLAGDGIASPGQAALPAPMLSRIGIADSIRKNLEWLDDDELSTTLAHLLSKITDGSLREEYVDSITVDDHPEEWPARLHAAIARQHLVEPDDLTSEYARQYLTEVSQRATALFRSITDWRQRQSELHEPVGWWNQWIECEVAISLADDSPYRSPIRVLYRYGDLTSQADGETTVECDFVLATNSGRETITKVLGPAPRSGPGIVGPASRSVSGDTVRDKLRHLALAVYEDAVRDAQRPAKRTGKRAKGGGA